jgi:hypothetical protein
MFGCAPIPLSVELPRLQCPMLWITEYLSQVQAPPTIGINP